MRQFLLPLSFIGALFFLADVSVAQSDQESIISESDEEKVVRIVRFSGNREASNRALRTLVRTRTNREFLGIPRFTPWYYINQVFGVGESPSYLNREIVSNDMERVRIYYENLGYFDVRVDTTIVEYRPNRVEVSFIIQEGRMSTIESVSYTGLPDFEDPELREDFFSESNFSGNAINDSTFSVSRQYRAQNLRQEQSRIISYLRNNGYASTQRDSVRALIKPRDDNPYQLDILYSIRPGGFYTFGDVYVKLAGPDGPNGYEDTLRVTTRNSSGSEFVTELLKQESAQSRFSLLSDQLQFEPGDRFSQAEYLRTVNAYQNLGMLLINRFGLSETSSLPDYTRDNIPVYFELQTLPKHSIRTEFFGMRRYGFGTGAGINYTNNNLFGRAENLTLSTSGNIEFVPSGARPVGGSTIFRSFEARTEYSLPRLNFPFSPFDGQSWVESSRTLYSLSYSQSSQEFFDVNSDIRINLRYEVNHSSRTRSFLDLIEMDVVDTDPSPDFRQTLLDQFRETGPDGEPEPDEVVLNRFEVQRILEDFRPQFSSIIRYTIRNQNTNLIKRNFGYFSEVSLAVGGNLPYLIDRYIANPGEIEGELSFPFGIFPNRLSYSRYVKISADYRRYIPLSPNTVYAFRLFGGYALPFGESTNIPLNRRFFAGGSNDIRGYSPFRLGPGGILANQVSIPGGDIKLAAFTEFRQIFINSFLNAQWHIAWHTDAGNVWYGPKNEFLDEDNVDILEEGRFSFDNFYNQIPVSSGIGVRLDWEFIIARFDITYRINDLERGWFNNGNRYFSFGIGHSF